MPNLKSSFLLGNFTLKFMHAFFTVTCLEVILMISVINKRGTFKPRRSAVTQYMNDISAIPTYGQFHQHFTYKLFVQTSFWQLFSSYI